MFTFELNLKVLIIICIFVNHSYKGKRCPEGWMRFGSSCYYKSTKNRTWIDSRSFCQFVGSDLVVVNSKEEQVGVFTLVPSSFLCLGFSTCMCASVVWLLTDSKVNRMFYHRFRDERISKDPNYNYHAVSLNTEGKWTQLHYTTIKNWICEKYITF
uniref:C-type lectin domain-containing protein n=1 Tax=Oryzias latipes TaxID=8090 RepID=A0A3P9KRL8_ORYLA